MVFEIDFNRNRSLEKDNFLREKLGAYLVDTNSTKYPPFEILKIEIRNFEHLKELLNIIEQEYNSYYSAIISYDPPIIYLDNNI